MLKENNLEANLFGAKCLRWTIFLTFVIFIANEMGVFIIRRDVMIIAVSIVTVLLILPTIIVNICGCSAKWVKYALVLISSLVVGVFYSLLTYHTVLVFCFPIFLALLYFNKKVTMTAVLSTCAVLIVSHLLGYKFGFVTDEPLTTLYAVVVYGIIPRIAEIICMSIIGYSVTVRASNLLTAMMQKSNDIRRNEEGLHTIIDTSQTFFASRHMQELATLLFNGAFEVVSRFINNGASNGERPCGVVALRTEDGTFYSINEGKASCVEVMNNKVIAKSNNVAIILPEQKNSDDNNVLITEDGVFMTFYDNKMLMGYLVLEIPVDKNDHVFADMLNILYNNIYLAIRNTKLNRDMFKAQEEIICAYAEISESKSHQTGRHIKRVAEYMRVMGGECGYTRDECENLAVAAMMHDIGKLMVPPEILEKPGPLTPEEFDVIKKHVTDGEALLRRSPGEIMKLARIIALQHHERWDGNGYLGIKGDNIDFNARLMAVADVFDSLVSKRSYKESWSPQRAYDEIVSQSGRQFDPFCVEVFKIAYSKFLNIVKTFPDDDEYVN